MFTLALFIGIYSYCIFTMGIFGILTDTTVHVLTFIWFILLLTVQRNALLKWYKNTVTYVKTTTGKILTEQIKKNIVASICIVLLIFIAFVNLLGALGPELAFDSLWYHLTLPKLYLMHHSIYFIPGGLFYYSVMPKLGEMLYTGALTFGNETNAKLLHFIFGILSLVALYKLSRIYFTRFISLLVILVFYSNLVVATESITAYIDLIRTFFEVITLGAFLNWYKTKKLTRIIPLGILTGLTITTKDLGIGSMLLYTVLITGISMKQSTAIKKVQTKQTIQQIVTIAKLLFSTLSLYWGISILIPLPWFIFAFITTGNPVYPFFSPLYPITPSHFSLISFFVSIWNLFLYSPDPLSPIYLISIPLLFVTYRYFTKEIKIIVWYCAISIIIWYFTPQTGGGRFILPYLPAFSLIVGAIYSHKTSKSYKSFTLITMVLLYSIIFLAGITVSYRFIANKKYIPVIIGTEAKRDFLTNHLNFSFGDFYDTDNYFATHIKPSDTVLLFGFHNLYYADFPYIDSSWVKKGDSFDYIATQKTKLPEKYHNWQLVYSNDKTMVQLYMPKKGDCKQTCYY